MERRVNERAATRSPRRESTDTWSSSSSSSSSSSRSSITHVWAGKAALGGGGAVRGGCLFTARALVFVTDTAGEVYSLRVRYSCLRATPPIARPSARPRGQHARAGAAVPGSGGPAAGGVGARDSAADPWEATNDDDGYGLGTGLGLGLVRGHHTYTYTRREGDEIQRWRLREGWRRAPKPGVYFP
jgi:hypothetical protein